MKALKIIFGILLVFFLIIIVIWLYLGITNVDKIYGEEMFFYQRNKICNECFKGIRKDICPRILSEDGLLKYPFAKEYKEQGDMHVDLSDYSDDNIIRNNNCESFHYELANDKSFDLNLREEPQRSYLHSLSEYWDKVWEVIGFFIWFGLCAITGADCSM